MIAVLQFGEGARLGDGRIIRRSAFVQPQVVSVTAACHVANAAVHGLGALLASQVSIEVTEPIALDTAAGSVLLGEARVLRVRGRNADAFVVVRPPDARGLAALVFAAEAPPERSVLSTLELKIVDRLSRAVASACTHVCGALGSVMPETAQCVAREAREYFELRMSRPLRAAIGVAVTQVHESRAAGAIRIEDLHDLRLEARVAAGRCTLRLSELSDLRVGSVVLLADSLDETATLSVHGRVIARGSCGVANGRFAFRVSDSPRSIT